jgi:hypothetical protein
MSESKSCHYMHMYDYVCMYVFTRTNCPHCYATICICMTMYVCMYVCIDSHQLSALEITRPFDDRVRQLRGTFGSRLQHWRPARKLKRSDYCRCVYACMYVLHIFDNRAPQQRDISGSCLPRWRPASKLKRKDYYKCAYVCMYVHVCTLEACKHAIRPL